MRDASQQRVLNAIDRGIRDAQEDYKKAAWTPLCDGPEHLITASIFYSLAELTKENSLTLETRVADVRAYLKGKPRAGRPPAVPRGTGRVDLCLWHKDEDRPRAIVEVKRRAESWTEQPTDSDIDRIAKLLLLRCPRKLGFGVLASCIHREIVGSREKAENKINDTLASLQETIQAKVGAQLIVRPEQSRFARLPLREEYPEDPHSKDWLWRPVVFIIHRRPDRR